MSSIRRARSAVTGRGEGWDIGGSSLRAEGCWTFNAQDRMPRSSPLTAHPLTANAKNAPAPTPPSRESGFVRGWFPAVADFSIWDAHMTKAAIYGLKPRRPTLRPFQRCCWQADSPSGLALFERGVGLTGRVPAGVHAGSPYNIAQLYA